MHGSKTPDSRLVAFGGGRLDRVDHVRSNPLLLAEAFASPLARRIVLEGLEPVVEGGHLVMEPLPGDAWIAHHALLGVDEDQRPIFAELLAEAPARFFAPPPRRHLASAVPGPAVGHYGPARSLHA